MAKKMEWLTGGSLAATVATVWLYGCLGGDIWLTLAITFGTIGYHLGVRLLVGLLCRPAPKGRGDYTRKWYRPRPWEAGLYRALRVKGWKDKLPTYDPSLFESKTHSWAEIAQATCQAELVHEINIPLSFLPLLTVRWFGAFGVFLLTSIGGACFDLLFVVIQRYNRARILKLLRREEIRALKKREGKDR